MPAAPKTLFDKIWDSHVVRDLGGGFQLLHVDRHLLHDLSGARGLKKLHEEGRRVRNPELTFASPDHTVSTDPSTEHTGARYDRCVTPLREFTAMHGIRHFDIGEHGHGIVHVIGPELGLTLPGVLLLCGDSHTCTHGGLGALAFGIGASELAHVLATQCIRQKKPKRMRAEFNGSLPPGIEPKDMILHLIGREGAGSGDGYAVEYAGTTVEALSAEGRMTLCNLSIEMGAKIGMVAPDETTFEYLHGREYAPAENHWDAAVSHWRTLPSDPGASFDHEVTVAAEDIAPQITWGTSPEHVVPVSGAVPDPGKETDADKRKSMQAALEYGGLTPGTPMEGLPIQRVFIGSCTNSRLSDLRNAAALAKGRRVAESVEAWVVPGSEDVKRAAEAEGLDKVFTDAGFQWRLPGCSLCVGSNGETVAPGARCVSTSNRNFVGRQGKGSHTHLASPGMAVAAAVAGAIADVRKLN